MYFFFFLLFGIWLEIFSGEILLYKDKINTSNTFFVFINTTIIRDKAKFQNVQNNTALLFYYKINSYEKLYLKLDKILKF